ncbi:Response regulator Rcp1 [Candidatus Magnetomoraceae bacterium gMMP-15]
MEQVDILMVEDNPLDEELALISLKDNNIVNNIHVVRDGEEAINFIFRKGKYAERHSCNPKLILLDLKLPKINGIEVLKAIRSDPSTKSIPVVVLTSSQLEKDIKECYELGVNSYIVKPVDFEQFTKVVSNMGFYWLLINEPPL